MNTIYCRHKLRINERNFLCNNFYFSRPVITNVTKILLKYKKLNNNLNLYYNNTILMIIINNNSLIPCLVVPNELLF